LFSFLFLGFMAGSGVSGCSKHNSGSDPDDLVVPFAVEVPAIEGVIDEPAWRGAARIEFRATDGRREPRYRTEARLLWDLENLYLAFDCRDPDINSSYTRRDEPLYMQEAVEIFLDPDADRQDYLEFEVSPANVLFDASFTARRQGLNQAYDPTIQSAVKVEGTLNQPGDQDRGWTVEMAIPFLGMTGQGKVPPGAGDRWRMNLYRLDKSALGDEASSWKSTAGDFHDLDAFGWIRFAR
jgi:hypothetical protein